MFEKAEILFVCIVNTGLAWMAEGAMRAKLPQAGRPVQAAQRGQVGRPAAGGPDPGSS